MTWMMACPVVVTSVVTMSQNPIFLRQLVLPPPPTPTLPKKHAIILCLVFSPFQKKIPILRSKIFVFLQNLRPNLANWIWVKTALTENMLLGFDFRPKSLGSMFCCGICEKNLASKISTSTWLSGRPGHHFYGSCDLNFARLHSHKSDGLGGEFHPPKAPPIPPKPPSTNHPNHHTTKSTSNHPSKAFKKSQFQTNLNIDQTPFTKYNLIHII